eukprot:6635329-Prymnesium_polylepis.2
MVLVSRSSPPYIRMQADRADVECTTRLSLTTTRPPLTHKNPPNPLLSVFTMEVPRIEDRAPVRNGEPATVHVQHCTIEFAFGPDDLSATDGYGAASLVKSASEHFGVRVDYPAVDNAHLATTDFEGATSDATPRSADPAPSLDHNSSSPHCDTGTRNVLMEGCGRKLNCGFELQHIPRRAPPLLWLLELEMKLAPVMVKVPAVVETAPPLNTERECVMELPCAMVKSPSVTCTAPPHIDAAAESVIVLEFDTVTLHRW